MGGRASAPLQVYESEGGREALGGIPGTQGALVRWVSVVITGWGVVGSTVQAREGLNEAGQEQSTHFSAPPSDSASRFLWL